MYKIIRHTYRIVEATKLSEYNTLTDDHKSRYALIISAGRVCIDAESKTYKALVAMFGAESATMTAIDLLYPTPQTNIPEEE
jgi:hypothetical protein